MKPKHLLTLGVLAGLTAVSVTAQQKPAPLPTDQQKLQQRVDALESQQKETQAKLDRADDARRDAKDYYEKAFNTLLKFGDWAVVLIAALPLVYGLIGFRAIDRRIQRRLRDASTQLRTEFNQRLEARFTVLEEKNTHQMKQLEESLQDQIGNLQRDLKLRADWQFQFLQGMSGAADNRPADAIGSFRRAVKLYKVGKRGNVVERTAGEVSILNVFQTVLQEEENDNARKERARQELRNEVYDGLEDELAAVAVKSGIDWLGPLLNERKPSRLSAAGESATEGLARPANQAAPPDKKPMD